MKFLTPQITYLLTQRETRRNLQALLRYLVFLFAVVVVYSILFHVLMLREGQYHSWLTGFYWTLTVMSTLGFGDITFTTDLGRAFSMLVLLSGIVLLLIVLPFAFIRFFYAPWLEAQIRLRAPRRVPDGTSGHLVLASWDPIARGLVRKLEPHGISCFVLEPDSHRAAELHSEGVSVIAGELDAVATYESIRARHARAVLANLSDAENTSLTLTVREHAPDITVVALAEDDDSVDILELAGADHVLPLKRRLGEHLASRVNAGRAQAHRVGRYQDLEIAEFTVHNTPLSGRAIRDTKLRQALGVNIVGVWERGRLLPADPDHVLTDASVPVVLGTSDQIAELDALLVIYDVNFNPVLVIGGGKVGSAAARTLREREVPVHLVERNPNLRGQLEGVADQVFVGDAADRDVLMAAGLADAPSVLLTTNDDATNIYLAVYCRRLNPELRIVSRITHVRNLEAIHRAGADFVLSYAFLGVESVFTVLEGRELILLGEGLEFLALEIPRSLVGRSLAEAGVRKRTGLNVVALQTHDTTQPSPSPHQPLPSEGRLLAVGTRQQRERFAAEFGA